MTTRVETVVPAEGAPAVAARIFSRWAARPYTFWLDSADTEDPLGRFSFLGTDPYAVVGGEGELWAALAAAAEPVFSLPGPEGYPAPFAGGLVGFIGYDGARLGDGGVRPDDDGARPGGNGARLGDGGNWAGPRAQFGAYDAIVCVDHDADRLYLVSTGLPRRGAEAAARAEARLAWLRREVAAARRGIGVRLRTGPAGGGSGAAPPALRSDFTRAEYVGQVERALARIEAGELEQVNLSQRFVTTTALSGPELYFRLRSANPAPFAAALHGDGGWILSSSPERFVHIWGDRIEMRPIKGTRPRGRDGASDEARRAALLASEKDAWENELIVQLAAAELTPLCVAHSVQVEERRALQRLATVFHLVSTVAGRLLPGADRVACVRDLFPAGSVTGRPKDRAMEVIDELEPVPRGVYTGAIGYFGVGGAVDFNVAIRTLVLRDGLVHFHVGGAVVAGSDPEDEYDETLDKAEGMVRALAAPDR